MNLWATLLGFTIYTAFSYWVVFKNGADRLEGWLAAITLTWWALNWTPEQIRFYALGLWIISLIGLFIKLYYGIL